MSHASRSIARAARRGQTPGWIDPLRVDAVGELGVAAVEAEPVVEVASVDLGSLTVADLRAKAELLGVEGRSRMTKAELIQAIRGS